MHATEIVVWAAASGAFGVLALLAGANALRYKTWPAYRLTIWVALYAASMVTACGLLVQFFPDAPGPMLQGLQVGTSTLTVSMSLFFFRFTAQSGLRSRWMDRLLLLASLLVPAAVGVACAVLPPAQWLWPTGLAIYAGAAIAGALALLVGVRDGEMPMAMGGLLILLTLPFDVLLYAHAMGKRLEVAAQAQVALTMLLKAMAVSFSVQPRADRQRMAMYRSTQDHGIDAATHLYSGRRMVQKIVRAQNIQRWTGGRGVVIAVLVRDHALLIQRHGETVVNALMTQLGARIELRMGCLNPVGCYGTDCFLVLVAAVSSPDSLRWLLRGLTDNLPAPVRIDTPYPGGSREADLLQPSLGLACFPLNPKVTVDAMLHELVDQARQADMRGAALAWPRGEGRPQATDEGPVAAR